MNSVAHPFLDRLFAAGPRLTLSIFVGIVVAVTLPDSLEFRLTTRLLLAWDCGALTYLSLVFFMMRHADVNEIKRRAAIYDEGGLRFLILAVLGVAASFVAIFAELAHTRGMVSREIGSITLAAMTVILSWSLTHVMFALHYAHLYYHGGHDCILWRCRLYDASRDSALVDASARSMGLRCATLCCPGSNDDA
jgi:uncharacterized membrane protein